MGLFGTDFIMKSSIFLFLGLLGMSLMNMNPMLDQP